MTRTGDHARGNERGARAAGPGGLRGRFAARVFACLAGPGAVLAAGLLAPAAGRAQTPPPAHAAPAGLSFENYRMVRTRNVFDPDRRDMTPAVQAAAPIQQSDYVALTGTMLNAGKALAFFSGSRADFNKVLGVREKIANATITDITAAGVVVERGGRKVTVAVGQTVPLDDKSAPGVPPPVIGAAPAAPAASGTAAAASITTAAAPAAPGAMNDKQQEIMKRMMEKRKQDGLQ